MIEDDRERRYTTLLNIIEFDSLKDNQFLQYLANLIDISFDLKKLEGINRALKILNSLEFEKYSSEQKSLLYYFSANAWSNKYELINLNRKNNQTGWILEPPDLEKVVVNLRLSIREDGFNKLDDLYKCNIFTNLGNVFDILGKFIEALECWDRAIEIKPDFGMALGNEGIGLVNYSNYIYDPGHRGLFIRQARKNFISATHFLEKIELYYPAYLTFQRKLSQIDNLIPEPKDHTCLAKNFSMGRSQKEKDYRNWCLKNRLFLNPLNDLGKYSIAANDIITTPNMVTPLDVGPRYQGFFNQLKQEYTSARYLCFEGIELPKTHFSDKKVLLYDTLDYPIYGFSIEKVKIAYRISYSLFDKIGFFLNEYLNLGIHPDCVYFKKIWFERKGKKDKKKEFLEKIKTINNPPLRGLYWLSKDLFDIESGNNYLDSLEPDSQNLYLIRNHLEHKYFKVHEDFYNFSGKESIKGMNDDLAYSIKRSDFEQKTIRLFKLVRNALIYLSLSINVEEKARTNKKKKEFYMPSIQRILDDRWKQ